MLSAKNCSDPSPKDELRRGRDLRGVDAGEACRDSHLPGVVCVRSGEEASEDGGCRLEHVNDRLVSDSAGEGSEHLLAVPRSKCTLALVCQSGDVDVIDDGDRRLVEHEASNLQPSCRSHQGDRPAEEPLEVDC